MRLLASVPSGTLRAVQGATQCYSLTVSVDLEGTDFREQQGATVTYFKFNWLNTNRVFGRERQTGIVTPATGRNGMAFSRRLEAESALKFIYRFR